MGFTGEELPPILDPIIDHKPGSGSGVVDWNDSSGLRRGSEKTLIVFYTDYQTGSCIAYSNDRGRTWVRHPKNPILSGVDEHPRSAGDLGSTRRAAEWHAWCDSRRKAGKDGFRLLRVEEPDRLDVFEPD